MKFRNTMLYLAMAAFSSVVSAQYKCDQVIENTGYKACYNYDLKATLFVAHNMRVADLKAPNLERGSMRFFEETKIPKRYRAQLRDFQRKNTKPHKFDRSHLVSDATANHSRSTQKATYSLVNVCHGYEKQNRGIWKYVEISSRKLAKRKGGAEVITGSVFDRMRPLRVGPGKVAVPTHNFKILKFGDGDKVAFLVPNVNKEMGKKASKYKVSIETINKMTGFDFR